MCVYACNYVLGVYIYIYIYYICDMYLLKHFQDLLIRIDPDMNI